MKVYVASKFENKEEVRKVQQLLIDRGHTITHDWTREDATGMTGGEFMRYMRDAAYGDVDGVRNADAIVLLNTVPGFGSMVELGMAIAWGKKIYVFSKETRDCIFFYLDNVQCFKFMDNLLDAVDIDDKESQRNCST